MKIVEIPKMEKEILYSVEKGANAKKIYEGVVSRAENCVDHLCGCSK
jgi:hypothetical protein